MSQNVLSVAVVTGALRVHIILLNVFSFSVKILYYYLFLQSGDLSLMMIFGYLFLIVSCFYLCVLAFLQYHARVNWTFSLTLSLSNA